MKENLQINKYILSEICQWHQEPDEDEIDDIDFSKADDYERVEEVIESADEYDGGYNAYVIIRKIADNTFYKINYQGWDLDHNFDDFEPKLIKVTPKQITKTIYV